jgi:hypothetical protein
MKKIYSALATFVAAIAFAAVPGSANATPAQAHRSLGATAIKPIDLRLNTASTTAAELTAVKAAKAQASRSDDDEVTIDDVIGSYYDLYYYYDNDSFDNTYITALNISKGEGENELIIENIWDEGYTVTATFEPSMGAIFIPKQKIAASTGYDVYIQAYDFDSAGSVSLLDDDITLFYDESDGSLMSFDYWGLVTYTTGKEPTDENAQGFYDYCVYHICIPTNGTSTYTYTTGDKQYNITENVACELEEDTLSVENFGGEGLIVTFTIDKEAKTATATAQAPSMTDNGDGTYVRYMMCTLDGNTTVVGTITGENGNVIELPDWTYTDGENISSVVCSGTKITTPFNLLTDSSINSIYVDNSNAPVEYFNIQGMRVANPTSGLLIKRQGSKSEKVVL